MPEATFSLRGNASVLSRWREGAAPVSAFPHLLQMSEHEGTDVLHGILLPGEARRIAAEHRPAAGAQDFTQIVEIALYGFHIGVPSAEQHFQITIGAFELAFEAIAPHLFDELRRAAQNVQPRAVDDRGLAIFAPRQRDAAQY